MLFVTDQRQLFFDYYVGFRVVAAPNYEDLMSRNFNIDMLPSLDEKYIRDISHANRKVPGHF